MMTRCTTDPTAVYDESADFCYTVSLVAAIEGATDLPGHAEVLPFVGMARAELVDFGQRQPARLWEVELVDIRGSMSELQGRVAALMTASPVLQQTLRLDAAQRHVQRALGGS